METIRAYAPYLLVFAGCIALIMLWQMGLMSAPHPLLGKPAPPLQLKLLDGGEMDLSKHFGKDVVVLDFFATWCPPCREGLPIIARLAGDYAGKGIAFYAINLSESPDKIRTFLQKEKLSLRVALDERKEGAILYQASSIPQTVIIGKDGVVHEVHVGLSLRMEHEFRQMLNTLSSAPAASSEAR